jgi:hypothetical protein
LKKEYLQNKSITMIRVTEIIEKSPYYLLCKFNNGSVKKLDVLPIIKNHTHLKGIESLLKQYSKK